MDGATTRRGGPMLLAESPLSAPGASLAGYLDAPDRILLAGNFAGVEVGVAAGRLERRGGEPVAVVELLYVEPEARRVGVGDALMEAVFEWAGAAGCSGVETTVLPGDQPSKAFFEAHGLTARALVVHRLLGEEAPGSDARERRTVSTEAATGTGRDLVPCAGAVVIERGRLLLVRRANPPEPGRWSLPGGRLEPGELPAEAAARETLEETGCAVVVDGLLGVAIIEGGTVQYAVDDFSARLADPACEPRAGGDASDAAFVPLEDVGKLELVSGLARWLCEHGVLPVDHSP